MKVEIIPCQVPTSKNCAIYLPKLTNSNQDDLWKELFHVFSQFGLIYRVSVFPSKFGESGIYYGFIRYYSCTACKTALLRSEKILINGEKIKILKSKKDFGAKDLKLSTQLAEELISFYFGFNAWSTEILYLEKDTCENPNLSNKVKFSCLVRITTKDGLISEGVGTGEMISNSANKSSRGTSYMLARKIAVNNAMSDAFSKYLIVLLPNGKRLLEVDTTKPDPLYLAPSLDSPQVDRAEQLEEEPLDESLDDEVGNEWVENLSDSILEKLLASTPQDHNVSN